MARIRIVIVLCALFNIAFSSGDLEVLYSPESIILQNTSQPLLNSDYSKFVSLCLAYSTEKPSNWNGFYGYKNFANIPLSVVTFHVPISLQSMTTQVFTLDDNSDVENQYSSISNLMLSKYDNSFAEMVDLFKNKDDISLKDQIHSLNSYLTNLKELKSKNLLPQRLSLWFNFISAPKADDISVGQFQLKIQKAVETIRYLVTDKVVILAIVDQDLRSLKRGARQAATKEDTDPNLAYVYDADYHTAFATIGFTTIILLLAVFGVSIAMWNIDPGRDSIIYRLTAQKMKKEQ